MAAPVARMTTSKVTILLLLALIFDALKFMATQLWFFGPALVGVAAGALTGSSAVGKIVGVLGVTAGLTTGIGEGIEIIGIVLAIAIGFLGWIILITLMAAFGIRFFRSSRTFLRIFAGFLVSELPFIDAVPSFTYTIWNIIRDEKKADKAAKVKYEAEQAAATKRQQRVALIMQKQQLAQEEAEAQAAQEEQDAADAEAAEQERLAQERAANDNEEVANVIPFGRSARAPLVGVPSLIEANDNEAIPVHIRTAA